MFLGRSKGVCYPRCHRVPRVAPVRYTIPSFSSSKSSLRMVRRSAPAMINNSLVVAVAEAIAVARVAEREGQTKIRAKAEADLKLQLEDHALRTFERNLSFL